MARLVKPVDLARTPLGEALELLSAAIDGTGDALLPTTDDAQGAAARSLLGAGEALRDGEDDENDPTAVIAVTSGSTGQPKGALLQASALRASAAATHERLGGSGHWLLALQPSHVAGVQVLLRSIAAGTEPELLDLRAGFAPDAFATAAERLRARAAGRCYTALVPTQVVRLLSAGGAGLAALRSFDAVLVGGAAASPTLLTQAKSAGVRLVTTYGMSETCGGCVYDGLPLRDVQVAVGGRISLGGPVVARGYRLARQHPALSTRDGTRWFTTDDIGTISNGRLQVMGRADDVIVSGGLKVSPQAVEAVVSELPGIRECLVVGIPDDEWGQRVVALVVSSAEAPSLESLRRSVSTRLGAAAAPRQMHVVADLPRRALGKPDRAAAARLAERNGPAPDPHPAVTRGIRPTTTDPSP